MSRLAIYTRVSTKHQNTEGQIKELHEWAARAGHEIVAEYDEKISGTSTDRPQFNAMMKAANRHEFEIVAVWAMDRFGRSVAGVSKAMMELDALGIVLYLSKQGVDTSTPVGKMFMNFLATFAEFEQDLRKQRQAVGIATAKFHGTMFGKPPAGHLKDPDREANIRINKDIKAMLKNGIGINAISRALSVGQRRVIRVRNEAGIAVKS
jgi:DNA invertase Pin-like site-specific DNA recombinase